jgi:hypothetical protein
MPKSRENPNTRLRSCNGVYYLGSNAGVFTSIDLNASAGLMADARRWRRELQERLDQAIRGLAGQVFCAIDGQRFRDLASVCRYGIASTRRSGSDSRARDLGSDAAP